MNRASRLASLAVTLGVVTLAWAQDGTRTVKRGRVVDEGGSPVSSASVTVWGEVEDGEYLDAERHSALVPPELRDEVWRGVEFVALASTVTDDEGRYRVTVPLASRKRPWRVTAVREVSGGLLSGEQGLRSDIVVRLCRRLALTVLSGTAPVVSASVLVRQPQLEFWCGGVVEWRPSRDWQITGREPPPDVLAARATSSLLETDANGQVSFAFLGDGWFTVTAPGMATRHEELANTCRELRLEPETFITGRVIDAEGRPVVGTLVEAHQMDAWTRLPMDSAGTDATGRFRLGKLADRSYRLHVAAPAGQLDHVASVRSPRDVLVTLERESRIEVTVRNADVATITSLLRPGPDANRVEATLSLASERGSQATATYRFELDAGRELPEAVFSGLARGRYRISLSAPPFDLVTSELLVVEPGKVVRVELALVKPPAATKRE